MSLELILMTNYYVIYDVAYRSNDDNYLVIEDKMQQTKEKLYYVNKYCLIIRQTIK